jgi:hypothetical protein
MKFDLPDYLDYSVYPYARFRVTIDSLDNIDMNANDFQLCLSLGAPATRTVSNFVCPGDGSLYTNASKKYGIEKKTNSGLTDDYGTKYKSDLLFADLDM